jgi:hypothetical protein
VQKTIVSSISGGGVFVGSYGGDTSKWFAIITATDLGRLAITPESITSLIREKAQAVGHERRGSDLHIGLVASSLRN